jgi:hypothetical protein
MFAVESRLDSLLLLLLPATELGLTQEQQRIESESAHRFKPLLHGQRLFSDEYLCRFDQ